MAILTIKNGHITRSFFNGRGFEVVEFYSAKDGEQKTRKFTAWFDEAPNLEIGQSGTFEGEHSTKIDLWTNPDGSPKLDFSGKQGQSVVVSLNSTVFTPDGTGTTAPKPAASATALLDEMPF